MYARLSRYPYRIVDQERADASDAVQSNPVVDLIAAVPGCRGAWVMAPEEEQDGQASSVTVFSLWETREQAERLGEVLAPRLAPLYEQVGIAPTAPPEVQVLVAEGQAFGDDADGSDGDLYARLSRWTMRVTDPERAARSRQDPPAVPLLAKQPGCRAAWGLLHEEEAGAPEFHGVMLSLWATRQQAEQVADLIQADLGPMFADAGVAPAVPPQTEVLRAQGHVV